MHRTALASTLALCLWGCANSIDDRLVAGDVSVCADDRVQQTAVISMLPDGLAKGARRANAKVKFESAIASKVTEKLGEISCDAIVSLSVKGDRWKEPFAYTVHRASDRSKGDFVVTSSPSPKLNAGIQLTLMEQFTPTPDEFTG